MWSAISAVLSAIMTGVAGLLAKIFHYKADAKTSEQLGNEQSKNAAHKANAARKEKSDAVSQKHIKKGQDLIDDLRDRDIDNIEQ